MIFVFRAVFRTGFKGAITAAAVKFFAAALFCLLLWMTATRARAASPVDRCFKAITGFAAKAPQSARDISRDLRDSAAEPQSALFTLHSSWQGTNFSLPEHSLISEVIRNTEIPAKNDWFLQYSASYIPLKKEKRQSKKDRGLIVLSLRSSMGLVHSVYWKTSLKAPLSLGEIEAQSLFEQIYERVYGSSPEVMLRLIEKAEPEALSHLDINESLSLKELFFIGRRDRLRELVLSAVEDHPLAAHRGPAPESPFYRLSDKISRRLTEPVLRGRTAEQLKAADADWIKSLSLEEIKIIFDTKEKIQALDMSLLPSGFQVELLTGSVLWRESITPAQIRQLDTAAEGIQYVFVPSFKHWTHDPHPISLESLSDSQIMRIDRDAFLRDVFLAGDTYIRGYISWEVSDHLAKLKRLAGYSGLSAIMRQSLSEEAHAAIASNLEFPEKPFEAMDAAERRLLFEAEARMMTDGILQNEIMEVIAAASG